MNHTTFARAAERFWNEYLAAVDAALVAGHLRTGVPDPVVTFPQSLLVTRVPNHFVCELVGGRRKHRPLRVLKHELPNIDLYFNQFNYPAGTKAQLVFPDETHHSGVSGLRLNAPTSLDALESRFPGVAAVLPSAGLISASEEATSTVEIAPMATLLGFERCVMVNSLGPAVRLRNIQTAVVVRRDTTEMEFLEYMRSEYRLPLGGPVRGVSVAPGARAEAIQRAAQFANLYLMNKLRETSIGAFLAQHEEVVLGGLGADRALFETSFRWQVTSPDPDEEGIRPDIVLGHPDGSCSVVDLKLPLLDRAKITRSDRRRRRFVDSVEDGIAQLAHYREFFEVPEHQALVRAEHGLEIAGARYALVVGNYENTTPEEVAEASRRLGSFDLLDYDTLLQLYVASSGPHPARYDSPTV